MLVVVVFIDEVLTEIELVFLLLLQESLKNYKQVRKN